MPTDEFAGLQAAFAQMVQRFNETRGALDAQMAEERRMRQEVQSLQHQVIRQERLAAVGWARTGAAPISAASAAAARMTSLDLMVVVSFRR